MRHWTQLTQRSDTVINVFEAVDVIALIKGGSYDDLTLSVGEALQKRSPVCFSSHFSDGERALIKSRISLAYTPAL